MALVLCLSLFACGKSNEALSAEMQNYVGTWTENEPDINNNTGVKTTNTLTLNSDGTGTQTSKTSDGYTYSQHGTWTIEDNQIRLEFTRATGDFRSIMPLSFNYDENGNLKVNAITGIYDITAEKTIDGYTKAN